jgi:hypothetical protein
MYPRASARAPTPKTVRTVRCLDVVPQTGSQVALTTSQPRQRMREQQTARELPVYASTSMYVAAPGVPPQVVNNGSPHSSGSLRCLAWDSASEPSQNDRTYAAAPRGSAGVCRQWRCVPHEQPQ